MFTILNCLPQYITGHAHYIKGTEKGVHTHIPITTTIIRVSHICILQSSLKHIKRCRMRYIQALNAIAESKYIIEPYLKNNSSQKQKSITCLKFIAY